MGPVINIWVGYRCNEEGYKFLSINRCKVEEEYSISIWVELGDVSRSFFVA
jgi:hypothetical protein